MKKLALIILALLLCVTVLASCGEEKKTGYDIDSASTYLHNLYKDEAEVTAVDYEVVGKIVIDGVTYTVAWTVDTDKVTVEDLGNGFVKINVDEESAEDVSYKLTATITDPDGKTATREYTHKVPKYELTSWESYMKAAEGDTVIVKGIVVAINSKAAGNSRNHLFLIDESGVGGYYSYQMEADPVADLGIKLGMTVTVTGPVAPYNGMQEIKGGTAAIVSEEIKEIAPIDITDKFLPTTDFNQLVGLPVTVKGVTIGAQELATATSQYLFFSLNGVESYVRTYVTDFPTTLKAEDKATIDADHAAHFGYKADVTGIMITYSGKPYIIPTSVTPFTNYVEVQKTPTEKVDAELDALKFDASMSADAVIELLLTGKYYNDVTITWATDDTTGAASIADGKLTIVVPDKEVTVKVTATVKCGDVTKTKEFSIKLSKSITPIKDLNTLGAAQESYTAEKYIAGGIITEIANETYGNMYIKDENGDILYIYGTFINGKKYGEADSKPAVGDYIVVVGVVGQYKGTPQMKNADITYFTASSSAKDANDAGAAQADNVYTDKLYLVTGVVTEIKNDKYGNIYIKDAEGNTLYVYGIFDQAGTRYDGMAKKPAVGDTVTVLGAAGQYKGAAQLKNATLVALTPAAAEGGETTAPSETTGTPSGETTTAPSGGNETPVAGNGVVLSVDTIGVETQTYAEGTATIGGVSFQFVQMGNYGDGLQMRDKDGKTSIIWNTTAFAKPIAKIELVYSDSKDVTYANADAVIFTFGNEAQGATYTTKLSTTAGVKTYTITPDASTYKFFKLEHDLGYTFYWKSITIVFADGTTANVG